MLATISPPRRPIPARATCGVVHVAGLVGYELLLEAIDSMTPEELDEHIREIGYEEEWDRCQKRFSGERVLVAFLATVRRDMGL